MRTTFEEFVDCFMDMLQDPTFGTHKSTFESLHTEFKEMVLHIGYAAFLESNHDRPHDFLKEEASSDTYNFKNRMKVACIQRGIMTEKDFQEESDDQEMSN